MAISPEETPQKKRIFHSRSRNKKQAPLCGEAFFPGDLPEGEVPIYQMDTQGLGRRARSSLTLAAYDTIKQDTAIGNALFFITYANEPEKYRLSYVKVGRDGKSDPKRFTYLLGEGLPTHPPFPPTALGLCQHRSH